MTTLTKSSKLLYFNAFLGSAILGLVIIFVVISNRGVAEKFSINQLRSEFNENNSALELQNSIGEQKYSLEYLTSQAKQLGLVEIVNAGAIYAEQGVALSK